MANTQTPHPAFMKNKQLKSNAVNTFDRLLLPAFAGGAACYFAARRWRVPISQQKNKKKTNDWIKIKVEVKQRHSNATWNEWIDGTKHRNSIDIINGDVAGNLLGKVRVSDRWWIQLNSVNYKRRSSCDAFDSPAVAISHRDDDVITAVEHTQTQTQMQHGTK